MKKRKAFTLSELLVVVVIIGVLSAVVLPKFSKVIETRKTTEAEELMSAVRTEQEARCTLSKKYTDQTGSLGSYKDGKNFDYSLGTVGMSASAKSGKYRLEMPSYADGRICCSSGCDSLNKNYPTCEELKGYSDYKEAENGCAIPPEPIPQQPPIINPLPSCDNSHQNGDTEEGDCECGKSIYTWNCSSATNYKWEKTLTTPCIGQPSSYTQSCGYCGTMNMVFKCQADNQWHAQPENDCEVPEGYSNACQPGMTSSQTCTDVYGTSGVKTRTCSDQCAWSEWSNCITKKPCEHGTREDGSCKEPRYEWKMTSTSNISIPSCPFNNINNPDGTSASNAAPMSTAACGTGHCPHNYGITITLPADGRKCGECNEQTGGHYCYSATGSSIKPYMGQEKFNFCTFTVFRCAKDWFIGYY